MSARCRLWELTAPLAICSSDLFDFALYFFFLLHLLIFWGMGRAPFLIALAQQRREACDRPYGGMGAAPIFNNAGFYDRHNRRSAGRDDVRGGGRGLGGGAAAAALLGVWGGVFLLGVFLGVE